MFDKDEIIEMARQAGIGTPMEWRGRTYIERGNAMLGVELEAFAKLVAAKERNEILKMCEPPEHSHQFVHTFKKLIAARGEA